MRIPGHGKEEKHELGRSGLLPPVCPCDRIDGLWKHAAERGSDLEKRRVTLLIGGQRCSLYSDDSNEYLALLEQRANEALLRTARFSGPEAYTNAVYSLLSLTDELLRAEQRLQEGTEEQKAAESRSRKNAAKTAGVEKGQVSVWDLLEGD